MTQLTVEQRSARNTISVFGKISNYNDYGKGYASFKITTFNVVSQDKPPVGTDLYCNYYIGTGESKFMPVILFREQARDGCWLNLTGVITTVERENNGAIYKNLSLAVKEASVVPVNENQSAQGSNQNNGYQQPYHQPARPNENPQYGNQAPARNQQANPYDAQVDLPEYDERIPF